MSIQHTSRTGDTYFLHVQLGKTGKPKYFFSTKPVAPLADCIPPGFEIFENVRGQVFLRRKVPQLITSDEQALVAKALRNIPGGVSFYKFEVKKNTIVIYEAPDRTQHLQEIALPWISKDTLRQHVIRSATYVAMLRFILADPQKRLFLAERFCFRGSVDDWIDIGGPPQQLSLVLRKYTKHLGKDSLFELF